MKLTQLKLKEQSHKRKQIQPEKRELQMETKYIEQYLSITNDDQKYCKVIKTRHHGCQFDPELRFLRLWVWILFVGMILFMGLCCINRLTINKVLNIN